MTKSIYKRVILIVLDSAGVGSLPDAADYGDVGADTFGHVADHCGGLGLPELEALGLGHIHPITGVSAAKPPRASWGKMAEKSRGKDTIAGHWEMTGIVLDQPFTLYPHGFPVEMLDEFMRLTGVKGVLGNRPASGTEIISELGEDHLRTGYPIVYTSGDSVFQIAAHEAVIPLQRQYEICQAARILCNARRIGRVIARPFIGTKGAFVRTTNRRDYPMLPPEKTALDYLKEGGLEVTAIGKIENIFAGQGIVRSRPSHDNGEGMALLMDELSALRKGLIFVNLVDFDMFFGHRRDASGYGSALEAFDKDLGPILARLEPGDLLLITADHGCDPSSPGTDHTREYVPLLAFSPGHSGIKLGIRSSFADIGATILENFRLDHPLPGTSFLKEISQSQP
jgi:phosphopentomutase